MTTRTHDDIRSYYTQTHLDYRAVWLDGANLAMHFGYHNDDGMGHSASLTNSNKVLADIAQVEPGHRVLDAGCGVGGTSLWLARERRAQVVGITLGADQVGAARREAMRRGSSTTAQFLVADFTALPFPQASFDIVWAQESLCHANDKAKFFQEASRVLRRCGRVVVADFMLKRRSLSTSDRALLAEWYSGWKLPGLWTAAEHVNAVTSAGLSDVSIQDVTANMLPSHRRLYGRARRARPLATLLTLAGLRNSIQQGNLTAALRQYETLASDCWFYAFLVAYKP
jgi:tocopherol O-methyltransferase